MLDPTPKGLNPVNQPDGAGLSGVGSPNAVVAYRKVKVVTLGLDGQMHLRGLRMLRHIRKRLCHNVIPGDLYVVREAARYSYIQIYRDRGTARQCPQHGTEPSLGQDRWVNTARRLAQFVRDSDQAGNDVGNLFPKRHLLRRDRILCQPQPESQRDKPLLRPSCKSRSIRRRVSSAAATIRARDAVSSARALTFAIAIAMRSAKSLTRCSALGGKASGREEPAMATPQPGCPP